MSWRDGLTGVHLQIASSNGQRIGVLAGPGTGKTSYGLMRRVARLLENGVPGNEVLLLSFTRTAAHDLQGKVADLGVLGADEVRATTLHAYCFGLLGREAVLEITRRKTRPLLDHEADLMLRDLAGDYGDLASRRQRLRAFEAGWARGTDDHPGLAVLPEDRAFEADIVRWLRHHEAMLVGEVVPIAHAYLRDNPASEELRRYRHIVVDEYQDLNRLEQRLIDLLADRDEAALCVAGDDDQSIYGFRFANPSGILDYQERPEVEKFEINVCGRCPRTVLSMANSLIRHAPDRSKPDLVARQEVDGSVAIVQWDDLDDEVDGITAAIAADIQQGRRTPGDVLVLVHRQRHGSRQRGDRRSER